MRQSPELATIETELTFELAASLIASHDFPRESKLPRLASIPYNNLGHLPLIDFELLRQVLWTATWEIYEHCRNERGYNLLIQAGTSALVFVAVALFFVAAQFDPNESVGAATLAGTVACILARPSLGPVVARVKANLISELLAGKTPNLLDKYARTLGDLKRAQYGSGIVGSDQTLVFFANGPSDLFPGLGWTQVHEIFPCPLSLEAHSEPTEARLYETLVRAIERARSSIQAFNTSGLVVSVDQNTVGKQSRWLDENLSPLLTLPPSQTSEIECIAQRDGLASTAWFAALQVLVLSQKTLITVLVRAFSSATSISFEIYICTLGPPSSASVQARIALTEHVHQHRRLERESPAWLRKLAGWAGPGLIPPSKNSALKLRLTQAMEGYDLAVDPLHGDVHYDEVEKASALAELVAEEQKAAEEVASLTSRWPGSLTSHPNSRELHSLTMTGDVFRSAECEATIKGLYTSTVRELLAAMESLGCDVSEYRGERGQLTITSENIGQLIVGESISMVRAGTAPRTRGRRNVNSRGSTEDRRPNSNPRGSAGERRE